MSFTAHGETESYFRGSEVLLLCEALTHSIEHPALFQTPDIRLMSQMQNCHPVSEENLNRTWLMTVDKYSSVLNRFLGSSFWTCISLLKIHWPCRTWVFFSNISRPTADNYFIVSGRDNFWPACGIKTRKITVYWSMTMQNNGYFAV